MKYLKKTAGYFILASQFVLVTSCLEPFNPRIPSSENNILIVEGYINIGPGKSIFKLSRTIAVGTVGAVHESGAEVSIVNDEGQSFSVTEIADGNYETGELNLSANRAYELHIRLDNGNEYVSQRLPAKVTPRIDSIYWKASEAIDIYVASHDDEGDTRYYQWSFDEDWQIRSAHRSLYMWQGDTIVNRPTQEQNQMFDCWKAAKSRDLIFGSTARLETDHMYFRLRSLPHSSEYTQVRYSMLVRQHALTLEHFNYLTLVQKNTTQVGSFFDPMPSEVRGNIVNVNNPDEMVVGYVGVYTTEQKRIFISSHQLPSHPQQERCDVNEFKVATEFPVIANVLQQPSLWIPFSTYIDQDGWTWLVVMDQYCLDCRLRGTSERPDFW